MRPEVATASSIIRQLPWMPLGRATDFEPGCSS